MRFLLPARFFSLFFVALLLGTSLPSPAQSPPPARKTPPQHPPPAATDQESFVSYWTTETGWRSELQLRNNQNADLAVTPVLRAADGTETPLSPVTIKPHEVKSVDLDAAIGTSAPQLIGRYGSLVLRFHSASNGNLYPVLMVRSMGHSIAFHIDGLSESQDFQAGGREGIWWLPSNSANDYLILTNQGGTTVPLDLSVFDASGKASTQKVILAPRATNRLSVRQLVTSAGLVGSYGGIKVSAVAHAGSLDTLHVLFDEKAGFSAVMKMFDYKPTAQIEERDYAKTGMWTLRAPMLALANPDPALGFPVGTTLRPQLFVRNTTAKPVDAALLFNWRSDTTTGRSVGPALRLSPYETRRIDVAALQDGKTLPQNARWTSVTLATEGLPDEVVAVAASYDSTLQYGAQTPFTDQLSRGWNGGQWEYDPYHESIITAGNGGAKPTQAAFTIFYNQGAQKYELEQTLQPDEQMWIYIGKLIREQIPDKNGKTLPADIASGSYEIRDLTNRAVGTLFEGKITFDRTYGHVTYGCAGCCGYDRPGDFWYNPLGIPVGSYTRNGVDVYDPCSQSWSDMSDYFYFNWSTASTGIATVDNYGTHHGVSLGSTTSNTHAYLQMQVMRATCPNALFDPTGDDNVMVQILLGGSNGTNITNTTQSVVVGQQIALYAFYDLSSGTSVNSQSWSVPGTIVGGFNTSSNSGGPTSANLNGQSTTFYWVTPASSQTVTFTLNYTPEYGGSQTATAQATFNVAGPTNVQIGLVAEGQPQILNNGTTSASIELGDPTGTPGIHWTGSATSPSQVTGTFEWAQIITSNSYSYTVGTTTTSCNGPTGLDNQFPLVQGLSFDDSPLRGLPSADNKFTWTWNATTYFMWNPGLTNSIRVPLGQRIWQYFADFAQNMSTHTWTRQSDSSTSAGAAQIGYFPIQWSSVAQNGSLGGCQ